MVHLLDVHAKGVVGQFAESESHHSMGGGGQDASLEAKLGEVVEHVDGLASVGALGDMLGVRLQSLCRPFLAAVTIEWMIMHRNNTSRQNSSTVELSMPVNKR